MTIRFLDVQSEAIGPYVEQLRDLERAIEYPIADGADAFRIDHGELYHPFFSTLGEAHFILALDGERVVGTVAGVLREGHLRGRSTKVFYGADLKVAPSHRGRRLPQRMAAFGLRKMFRTPRGLSWRYAYVAAMRGEKGDVMRTVRGVHVGHLGRRATELLVFFVEPERLAAVDRRGAPGPLSLETGIDLSPPPPSHLIEAPGLMSTAGRKDLRLRSTGAPWPLVHLPYSPARALPSWDAYLAACGEAMFARGLSGPACFAIDVRLREHLSWLASNGIEPNAVCTIYALSLTPRTRGARWLHLSTSEI